MKRPCELMWLTYNISREFPFFPFEIDNYLDGVTSVLSPVVGIDCRSHLDLSHVLWIWANIERKLRTNIWIYTDFSKSFIPILRNSYLRGREMRFLWNVLTVFHKTSKYAPLTLIYINKLRIITQVKLQVNSSKTERIESENGKKEGGRTHLGKPFLRKLTRLETSTVQR